MIDRTFSLTQNIVICFRTVFKCTLPLCDKKWYLLKMIIEKKYDTYPQTLVHSHILCLQISNTGNELKLRYIYFRDVTVSTHLHFLQCE